MTSRQMVAGVVLALTLCGCSAGSAPPVTDSPAASAATSEPAAPETSAAAPAGDASVDEFVTRLSTAMKGVKTYAFDIDMETEAMGTATTMKTKGVVDQTDPDNKSMSMDADILGMAVKLLQVDGELYIQMEVMGKKWMQVPEDQKATYGQAANTGDISSSFEQSKAAIKKIDLVGEETVDGTATKHYRVTYDGSALPELTGGSGAVVGDAIEYHMWVDSSWLIRKVTMDATASADGKEVPFTMSGTLGDYNEPVTIKAPSKDQLTTMPG